MTNADMVAVMQWAYANSKLTVSASTVQNVQGDVQELLDLDSSDCQISWDGGTSTFAVDTGFSNYPCVEVTWYGACAYANYRSEMDGLTPCYDLSDWSCNWSANGYRLPTEAEWEYAARGGAAGSNTKYSGSDTIGDVAWYWDNSNAAGNSNFVGGRGTLPVGGKAANELGICDMSGNVWEWCSDRYDSGYYQACDDQGTVADPTGPSSGSYRVGRGGGWGSGADNCRVASRNRSNPGHCHSDMGFRLVRATSVP